MFITIEGTDASGKTSLISAVLAEVEKRYPSSNIVSLHKGKPVEETRRWVLKDYVTSVESYDMSNTHIVSDRWHWGEVTYAPLKRPHTDKDGYGLLTKAGWRWVELFLMSRGVASFWLYQPLEVIQRRIESRGDDFVNKYELEEILDRYLSASALSVSLTERLMPGPDSLEKIDGLAKYIVDTAEKNLRSVSSILKVCSSYIGSPRPRILLVGDKRNILEEYGEETKLPFMPVDGNSGEFLLNALPTELWPNVGIVNGAEITAATLNSLWEELSFPKVIALGREAEKACHNSLIPSSRLAVFGHPQFIRRFSYKEREAYGLAMQDFLQDTLEKESQWILR